MLFQRHQVFTSLLSVFLVIAGTASYCQSHIDSRIVLRVDNISMTAYELEKNFTLFKDNFWQRNGSAPGNADIDQWIQSFIDRTYLLADAYQKRYDTLAETNKWVTAMERFIVSQPGGLLDDKLGGELTEAEIEEGVRKNLRKVHFRYIKFPDQNSALTLLGGAVEMKTNQQFEDLLKRSTILPDVIRGEDAVQWPFFHRGEREELILNMREGEVSSLITLSDGIYIAQVKRIELIEATRLSNIRQGIISMVRRNKMDQVRRKFYDEVIQQAQIEYDDVFMAAVKDHLAKRGNIRSLEKDMFADLRSRTAITYQLDNKKKYISVDRWMTYLNDLPMRQEIGPENLRSYLEAIVFEDYAYQQAEATGVTKDPKFVLDRANYIKSIVWMIYEREELKKGITVTEEEIFNKYQQTKTDYVQPTDVVITAFSFPDRRSIAMAMGNIRKGNLDSLGKGSVIERHRSIKYNDDLFSDSIRAVIFSMRVNDVSAPLYNKGAYLVVIKEAESGSRTRELQEARATILKKIEEEKLEQKKQLMLVPLKKRYSIQNEIDYAKYHIRLQ